MCGAMLVDTVPVYVIYGGRSIDLEYVEQAAACAGSSKPNLPIPECIQTPTDCRWAHRNLLQ
jgi:hypothetical protein